MCVNFTFSNLLSQRESSGSSQASAYPLPEPLLLDPGSCTRVVECMLIQDVGFLFQNWEFRIAAGSHSTADQEHMRGILPTLRLSPLFQWTPATSCFTLESHDTLVPYGVVFTGANGEPAGCHLHWGCSLCRGSVKKTEKWCSLLRRAFRKIRSPFSPQFVDSG